MAASPCRSRSGLVSADNAQVNKRGLCGLFIRIKRTRERPILDAPAMWRAYSDQKTRKRLTLEALAKTGVFIPIVDFSSG